MRFRSLAFALVLGSAVAGSSFHTRASVDPYTAAQTIAGVLSLINGIAGGSSTKKWQEEAAGKLDLIIQQNGTIISELRSLRLYVPQALEEAFNREIEIKIKSYSTVFDQYMQDPKRNREKFQELVLPVSFTAYDVAQRGPSLYLSAASVTTLGIGVLRMSGNNRDVRFFVDQMLATMNRWAGEEPGMLGAALREEQTVIDQHRNELAAIPRGDDVVIHSAQSSIPIEKGDVIRTVPCMMSMHARVVIDEANFQHSVTVTNVDGCDTGSFDESVKNERQALYSNLIQAQFDAISSATQRRNQIKAHRDALLDIIENLSEQ